MKKESKLLIKLTTELRDEFQGYAKSRGHSVSSLIRHLMEFEMRGGQVVKSLTRPLIEGKYGKAAEVITDDGKVYHVQVVPFRSQTTIQILDPESEHSFANLIEARGRSSKLDKVIGLMESSYSWDDQSYQGICAELGLDPNIGRPFYHASDAAIIADLNARIRWSGAGTEIKMNNFIFDLLDLLRTSHDPEYYAYERCKAILTNWTFRLPKALFQEAFDRIDLDRIRSSEAIFTSIRFLPSWAGRGYHASIDLFITPDCEADGWDPELYSHLSGVALAPSRIDFAMSTVLRRLKDQGVAFLDFESARDYMNEEGSYWAFVQNSYNCPPDLEPQHTSRSEKLLWKLKRPKTPRYDQHLKRQQL